MEHQAKRIAITRVNEHSSNVMPRGAEQDVRGGIGLQNAYLAGQYSNAPYMMVPVPEMQGEDLKRKWKGDTKLAVCRVEDHSEVGLAFFDTTLGGRRLFTRDIKKVRVTKLLIFNGKYVFALVEICDKVLVFQEADIKPGVIYDEFIKAGFTFNPSISRKKAGVAFCDYLNRKLGEESRWIELSGEAGWEDGIYKTSSNYQFLERFKFDVKLPVFEKKFDKGLANLARIVNYKMSMQNIVDPQNRLIIALTPFAGILYTPLVKRNLPAPFALNLVVTTDRCALSDLVWFFQIFNRDGLATPYNTGVSSKEIMKILNTSKDEVMVFAGFEECFETYYANQKNIRTLNLLAEKALGKLGGGCGENGFRSVLVLISNQQILQPGVKNIFVGDDFFEDFRFHHYPDEIMAVLALFVNYLEGYGKELQELQESGEGGKTRSEIYWKSLLSVVDDFWRAFNFSLTEVLGFPETFDYSFLWQESEESLEQCAIIVKRAVRKEMKNITAVEKEISTSTDSFIYDESYIWISSELFSKILRNEGLGGVRNQLLLGCKNEDFLITNQSERGFTTRLQTKGSRREFYKFDRKRFTGLGEVEILDLAGGNKHC